MCLGIRQRHPRPHRERLRPDRPVRAAAAPHLSALRWPRRHNQPLQRLPAGDEQPLHSVATKWEGPRLDGRGPSFYRTVRPPLTRSIVRLWLSAVLIGPDYDSGLVNIIEFPWP